MKEYITLGLAWGPTALFGIIVIVCFITGAIKGFRRGLILLLIMILSLFLTAAVYSALVSSGFIDNYSVPIANFFLRIFRLNSVQEMLGLNTETTSLIDLCLEYLLKNAPEAQKYEFMIMGSKAYVAIMANVIFNVVAILLVYPIYLFFKLIFLIIYLKFFSEKKYRRRKRELFEDNMIPKQYKKKRFSGALVGIVRGSIKGLILMSFVGSLLFVFFGTGESKRTNITFGNKDYNDYYQIYQSASSYGETGIFDVLNKFKDSDDMPYYFLIADLLLSTNVNDIKDDFTGNVVYRKELNNYFAFTEDLLDLVIKYNKEDVVKIIEQNDTALIQEVISNSMQNKDFMIQFRNLIDDFEVNTLFINMGVSLIDTIARNLKELSQVVQLEDKIPTYVFEIVDIMFGEDGFAPSEIITKDDIKYLLCASIDVYSDVYADITNPEGVDYPNVALKYCDDLVNMLNNLSLFNNKETKKKGNIILNNLYTYLAKSLSLNHDETEFDTDLIINASGYQYGDVDWLKEIFALIDLAKPAINIYNNNNLKDEFSFDKLNYLFSDENELKEQNMQDFDSIIEIADKSDLLGALLSVNIIEELITRQLRESTPLKSFEYPTNINYASSVDNNGQSMYDGEIYKLLSLYRAIINNDLINKFTDVANNSEDSIDSFKQYIALLNSEITNIDGSTSKLSNMALDSRIIVSVISQSIDLINESLSQLQISGTSISIFIPNTCYSNIDSSYKHINKSDLEDLINSIDSIFDLVQKLSTSENLINTLVSDKDSVLDLMSKSKILEGTICSIIYNTLISYDDLADYLVFTANMSDINTWVDGSSTVGEIKALFNVIENSSLGLSDVLINQNTEELATKFQELIFTDDDEYTDLRKEFDLIKTSRLLYYSISNILLNSSFYFDDDQMKFSIGYVENSYGIIIPDSELICTHDVVFGLNTASRKVEQTKEILYVLDSDILIHTLKEVRPIIDLMNDQDGLLSYIVSNLDKILNDKILHATLIGLIQIVLKQFSSDDFSISIPKYYEAGINKVSLKKNFEENIWVKNQEILSFFNALDELTNIRTKIENNSFSIDSFSDDINNSLVTILNESEVIKLDGSSRKLDVVYKSAIMRKEISVLITDIISSELVNQSEVVEDGKTIKLIDYETLINSFTFYQVNDYFELEEIENLLNSLELLGINYNDLINNSINTDVIDAKLFSLDELAPSKYQNDEYNLTNLDIIYQSYIAPIYLSQVLSVEFSKFFMELTSAKSTIIYSYFSSIDYQSMLYKQEIFSILKALKVNGINSFSDLNSLNPEELLFNLDKDVDDGTHKTYLDYCYNSKVISFMISKIIDHAFIDNNIVSDLVLLDIIKKNSVYEKNEIIKLLAILQDEFEINNFESFEKYDFTGIIFNIRNNALTDSTKTLGDVLFDSKIVRVTISSKLDMILDDFISSLSENSDIKLSVASLDSVKTNGAYTINDIEGLLDVLNELGINKPEDLFNFESEEAIDLLFTMNEESIVYSDKTRFDVVYGTSFNKVLFSIFIDLALTSSKRINDTSLLETMKDSQKLPCYSDESIISLPESLEIIGINKENLDNFEIDVNSLLHSLNMEADEKYQRPSAEKQSKLEVIYRSDFAAVIVTSYLENTIRSLGIRGDFIELFKNKNGTYIRQEVVRDIIDMLLVLDISDFTAIDIEKLFDKLLEVNDGVMTIEKIYNLSNNLYGAIFIREALRYEIDSITKKDIYKTVYDIESSKYQSVFLEEFDESKSLYKTEIMLSASDYSGISELGFYKVSEIKRILQLIKYIRDYDDLPISAEACQNAFGEEGGFEQIATSSSLLMRFISTIVLYGYDGTGLMYVPSTDFDSDRKCIKNEELSRLITAIAAAGTINAEKIILTNSNIIIMSESNVLRATLSMNLSFNASGNLPSKLYIDYSSTNRLDSRVNSANGYYEPIKDFEGIRLLSFTKSEFIQTLSTFIKLGANKISVLTTVLPTSIDAILAFDDTKLSTLLSSNIFKNYVSQIITSNAMSFSITYMGINLNLYYNSTDFKKAISILRASNKFNPDESYHYVYNGLAYSYPINSDNSFNEPLMKRSYNMNNVNATYYSENVGLLEEEDIVAFIKLVNELRVL